MEVGPQALGRPLPHPHLFTICEPSKLSSSGSVLHDHVSVEYCLSGLLWLDAEGGNAFPRFTITCFFPHFSS